MHWVANFPLKSRSPLVGTLLLVFVVGACQVRFLPQDGGAGPIEPEGVVEPAVGPEGGLEPDPAPSQPEPGQPEPIEPDPTPAQPEPDGEPAAEPDGGPTPEPVPEGEPGVEPDDGGTGVNDDAGSSDVDAGEGDAGPLDAGPIDAGPIDAGPIDAGPVDAGPPPAICGNGALEFGEACDDDNLNDRDGCSSECTDWWDTTWPARASVVINRQSFADEILSDVPVLVRISSALATDLGLESDSYCFVADDDVTVLPSQIERFGNPAENEESIFWVRVPSLPGGITTIQLYAGGTNGCPRGPEGDVFASSYTGVWHFNDIGWSDATGRGRNLTATAGGMTPTDGMVGRALRTDTGDVLRRDAVDNEFVHTGSLTLEAWVRVRGRNGIANGDAFENTLIHVASGAGRVPAFTCLEDSGVLRSYWGATSNPHNGAVQTTSLGSPVTLDEWVHVATVRDADNNRDIFYENGVEIRNTAYSIAPRGDGGGFRLYIGGNRYSSNRDLIGSMDEVRISDQPHSEAWMRFQYNQMANAAVVTLGGAEAKPQP